MRAGEELRYGYPETKLQDMVPRTHVQPFHLVGHHRSRSLQQFFSFNLIPTPAIHIHIPHQMPNWCRPFNLTGNCYLWLRHARPLACSSAPTHSQNRHPSTSRRNFPPFLCLPIFPRQRRLQKTLRICRTKW